MKYNNVITIKTGRYKGRKLHIKSGVPTPFGATMLAKGVNFSLFSKHGKRVVIAIFLAREKTPVVEVPFDAKNHRTGDVWHIGITNLPPHFRYCYRIGGDYSPAKGHYFNENRYLIDPYARALAGGEAWGDSKKEQGGEANQREQLIRYCFMPMTDFDWEDDKPINRPLKDTIIYELHTRGFTIHPSSKVKHQGTFEGVIEKIPYFKELGINAIELMPINEFDENECMFSNPVTGEKLKNFWGYSSISFFAPKAAYAANGKSYKQVKEFKRMVRELHKAGIEVILDVVFNHTAEGNERGPTICYRGIENSVYYMIDRHKRYKNFSGCGNTINCNHPVVREMILTCLRYWVTEMHVDGFRFDLASILGRDQHGNVLSNPPVLEAIALDPVLSNKKIIAEAWDAAGLYQVGHFPAWQRWSEWNDKYRDCIRRFIKGDHGVAAEMATRIAGSSDLYGHSGRKPYHSINYITSHDGFTLHDLVSYNEKYNMENGENNRDGMSNNYSWNCGAEGKTNNPIIKNVRLRQAKNFIALLMISQGTPMLLAGDEFGRTQYGNNNAYCQDNDVSWIDWQFKLNNRELLHFTKEMIKFRKSHETLRRETFFTGEKPYEHSFPDISWHSTKLNKPDFSENAQVLAFLISGNLGPHVKPDNDIYVAVNTSKRKHMFKMPSLKKRKWFIKADTFRDNPHDIISDGKEVLIDNQKSCPVKQHSVVILISK